MDLNFNWIEKSSKGRGKTTESTFVLLSVNRNGKDKKNNIVYAVVVTFYDKAISEFRIMNGDYVEIGFDKTAKLLAIKRTDERNGYKVGKVGKNLRTQFPISSYPFAHHESIVLEKSNLFEQDGMYIFNLSTFGLKEK